MEKHKRIKGGNVVVDQEKLDKLRKKLSRTINDFKRSVLESLETREDGPIKDHLRLVEEDNLAQGDTAAQRHDPAPEAMPRPVEPKAAAQVPQPEFIHVVKPVLEEQTGIIPMAEVEQWVSQKEEAVAVRSLSTHVFFAGLDNLVNSNARNFFQKMGIRTFLPSLEGHGGRSIVESFQEYIDFSFAVVVLSADGYEFQKFQDPANALQVASQKTVYELGFLVGKLGRSRVAVLFEDVDKFKRPTEYFDLSYTAVDASGLWQQSLINQMKASGIVFKEEAVLAA